MAASGYSSSDSSDGLSPTHSRSFSSPRRSGSGSGSSTSGRSDSGSSSQPGRDSSGSDSNSAADTFNSSEEHEEVLLVVDEANVPVQKLQPVQEHIEEADFDATEAARKVARYHQLAKEGIEDNQKAINKLGERTDTAAKKFRQEYLDNIAAFQQMLEKNGYRVHKAEEKLAEHAQKEQVKALLSATSAQPKPPRKRERGQNTWTDILRATGKPRPAKHQPKAPSQDSLAAPQVPPAHVGTAKSMVPPLRLPKVFGAQNDDDKTAESTPIRGVPKEPKLGFTITEIRQQVAADIHKDKVSVKVLSNRSVPSLVVGGRKVALPALTHQHNFKGQDFSHPSLPRPGM